MTRQASSRLSRSSNPSLTSRSSDPLRSAPKTADGVTTDGKNPKPEAKDGVKKDKTGRKRTASATRKPKLIYLFGSKTDGDASLKELLGGKGANLAEMTSIGLPVPPGFTIPADACRLFYERGQRLPSGLMEKAREAVKTIESQTGKGFGDASNPLLVSVRSGAAVSMPGMMDTVLNLGLNDRTVEGLAKQTDNERFAFDAYRRLINMFGDVVMGVKHELFEEAFDQIKTKHKASVDTDVPAEGLRALCDAYKKVYEKAVGESFPQDPKKQLKLAIEAVFKSWDTPRAKRYRQINGINGLLGTAVSVQAMVFGNMGEDSGTGVAFTRNPSTGENALYGEFLINAQGEDVVAGIRTPRPISEMPDWDEAVYTQLSKIKSTLEKHYRDMQDIEFTVEKGKLWMLQTRRGKRAGRAAVRIAVEMNKSRLIDRQTALQRVPAKDLAQLLLPSLDPDAKASADVIAEGLPASPGVAVGKPAFTAEEVVARAHAGEKVILVRRETSPEDVDGMHSAAGILTSTGGMTSHAAVVARGWGKCCIAGAGDVVIDATQGEFTVKGRTFGRADVISLDGSTGEVIAGAVDSVEPEMSGDFDTLMKWADSARRLKVRANADTPADATRARELGAQGIGLCRTEHMFFDADRIPAMREMILAETKENREKALDKLLPFQRNDFVGIFKAMDGLPVTVRLLDPPLHEFLPHEPVAQEELARRLGVPVEQVRRRVTALDESNPMMGHRGARLAVTYPEILEMQVRAITEAAIRRKQAGANPKPEIMIPLIGVSRELEVLRELTSETIRRVKKEKDFKGKLQIPIGTMIEVPRAAIRAGAIAEHADFFSFGTNDLTQLTFGYSRDDVNGFLPAYLSQEILPNDPFESLDQEGVGALVETAVEAGRKAKPKLKIGICGEHGGDPASVAFCERVGLDYVSCSPFRAPIARLAAAQAMATPGE
jgi:pyruvate, orthophosphate dikinase